MAKPSTLRQDSESFDPIVDGESTRIDMREAKQIVRDLMTPNPWIYWPDMVGSSVIGWWLLYAAVEAPPFSGAQLAAIVGSSFVLYRALVFIHEIAHMKGRWVGPFAVVWNLLCGIPLFQPTSFYGISHLDHHKTSTFATAQDPRYVPVGLGPRSGFIMPLLVHTWIAPIIMALRMLVVAPLSIVAGGNFRDKVIERASTFAMNLEYHRPLPDDRQRRIGMALELGSAAFWWTAIVLAVAGIVPVAFFGVTYSVLFCIMVINYVRSLCSHLYIHHDESVDFEHQLLDSISIVGPFSAAALFAPIGLRYHSLHHFLPSLPYHSMGAAHRRLVRALPRDHVYRRTLRLGMGEVLGELWARCGRNAGATKGALR